MSTELEADINSTKKLSKTEQYYVASNWVLMRRRFFKHKFAVISLVVLVLLYLIGAFAGFVSPYDKILSNTELALVPPTRVRIFHDGKLRRPFVYQVIRERNPDTFLWEYSEDKSIRYPIKFGVKGDPYKFVGIFDWDVHLFGVDDPAETDILFDEDRLPAIVYLFGADQLGRCVFSRTIYGARISLSIGLVGVFISFILGCLIGGISGFAGGAVDMALMRSVEFIESIPGTPMWMAMAAAIPIGWPTITKYFLITVILSLLGWTGLSRTVRGKILALREEDYVMAARISGQGTVQTVARHMLPNFMGYLIVSLTLSVPGMILGETGLSFLGLGLQPPVVSWGVALQQASNIRTIAVYYWLLIPALFVVVAVLVFNFVGDGLRDAADPYK